MLNITKETVEEDHYSIEMSVASDTIYVYRDAILRVPVEIEGFSDEHFDDVLDEIIMALQKAKELAKELRNG